MAFNIEDYIRDIKDFPKPGIVFKDITPLLADAYALKETTKQLLQLVPDQVDKVIGIEARGFFFGTLLAEHLNAGFVPIRKPGKLPYKTYSEDYELEYGTDSLSMHIDAIKPGEKVLIHDDVLATGGTAEAVAKLVEKAGGEVVMINFLIELSFLKGRNKLANYNVSSLIKY
ncbi:MAG TPA: adenine phosphoribosyltransferase [Flavobacteriia bacterium]|nr:adenine phosphoribosyltransferase [Flavobacteriia bacterium]